MPLRTTLTRLVFPINKLRTERNRVYTAKRVRILHCLLAQGRLLAARHKQKTIGLNSLPNCQHRNYLKLENAFAMASSVHSIWFVIHLQIGFSSAHMPTHKPQNPKSSQTIESVNVISDNVLCNSKWNCSFVSQIKVPINAIEINLMTIKEIWIWIMHFIPFKMELNSIES